MFLPDNIDLGKPEKYTLSIRIDSHSFAFSISEQETYTYCYRETIFSEGTTILSNVQRIVFDYNFLTQNFKLVNVLIATPDYEIVPKHLFEKVNSKKILEFTHQKKFDKVLISGATEGNTSILSGIKEDLYDFLMRSLYAPHFHHHIDPLINYFGSKIKLSRVNTVYINVHNTFVDVICFEKSKFCHVVTYENANGQDLLFYILNIWDKCDYNQLNDFVFISGNIHEEVLANLRLYIKNIEKIGLPSEALLLGEDVEKTPLDLLILSI